MGDLLGGGVGALLGSAVRCIEGCEVGYEEGLVLLGWTVGVDVGPPRPMQIYSPKFHFVSMFPFFVSLKREFVRVKNSFEIGFRMK